MGQAKQAVRVINIMDEGSRRALWTEAYRSISAKTLTEILDKVVEYRGRPKYIRCDNGPEFISKKRKHPVNYTLLYTRVVGFSNLTWQGSKSLILLMG